MLEKLLTVVGLPLLVELGEAILTKQDEEAAKAVVVKMMRKAKRALVKQARGG